MILVLLVPGLSTVGRSSASMSGPTPSAALTPKVTPLTPPTLTPPPSALTPAPHSGSAPPDVPSIFTSPSSISSSSSSPYSSVLQSSHAPLHASVVSPIRPPPPGPPTGPPVSSFSLSAGYDITRGHAGRTPQTPLMPTFSASTALPSECHQLYCSFDYFNFSVSNAIYSVKKQSMRHKHCNILIAIEEIICSFNTSTQHGTVRVSMLCLYWLGYRETGGGVNFAKRDNNTIDVL